MHFHISYREVEGKKGDKQVTTVQDWVSTFVSVTLVDILKGILGQFPAVSIATKTGSSSQIVVFFQPKPSDF